MNLVLDHDLQENELGLPHDLLSDRMNGQIQVGQWEKEFNIRRHEGEEIHVPEQFFPFHLPFQLPFQVQEEDGKLRIGPIIAFLVTYDRKDYHDIKKYLPYMLHYKKVGGLVFITTISQTDFKNGTMSGFFYNPLVNDFDHEEKSFPFPDAIYRRCAFKEQEQFHILRERVNGKMFNGPILDKYEQYRMIRNKKGFSYFPNTILLDTISSLENFLETASIFYIKPISSYKGKGIIYVRRLENGYKLIREKETTVVSEKELISLMGSLEKGKYIVQNGIEGVNNRNIAFRVIMQKNESNDWVYTGGYARIGKKGSVVTNRLSTKKIMPTETALEQYFHAPSLLNQLISACQHACESYDSSGVHFGDLAFDVMVDKNLRVWIIEVNNRAHNHRSPLLAMKDTTLYSKVVSTPLLYCKYLSGF